MFRQIPLKIPEFDALLDPEGRLLVHRLANDADHDAVENRSGAPDDVHVPESDRIVRAGVDRGDQCWNSVRRAEPYVRDVRTLSPSSAGSRRLAVS